MFINCYVANIFILLKTNKIRELIESMFFDLLHCYTMPAMGKGRHYLFFVIINYASFALYYLELFLFFMLVVILNISIDNVYT